MEYSAETLLRLTKRWNNPKRSYLLVNPLQGKHIPASPGASWEMMQALGRKLAGQYPDTRLVIGFAETATAVGAVAAGCFGPDCIYIHTTREEIPGVGQWVRFQEEHSHAVDQKICGDRLAEWFRDTPQVVILDDELSTGKTLCNIVSSLRGQYPELEGKPIVAASLINRLTEEHTARFTAAGIQSTYLVKPPEADYSAAVARYSITPAEDLRGNAAAPAEAVPLRAGGTLPDPRTGVFLREYRDACEALAGRLLPAIQGHLPAEGKVLVLGTEECMYPALVLGKALEALGADVSWQATTRSPIGICQEPGYPVTEGFKIRSFYDPARETFLYNLRPYDLAVLLTDAGTVDGPALQDVSKALYRHGCRKLLYVQGG